MDHRYLLALSGILFLLWLGRLVWRRRRRRRARLRDPGTLAARRAALRETSIEESLPSESDWRAEMDGLLHRPSRAVPATRDDAVAAELAVRDRARDAPAELVRMGRELRRERSRVEALTRRVELAEAWAADRERSVALLRRNLGERESALEARDTELEHLSAELGRSPSYRKRIVALDTALSRIEVAAGAESGVVELKRLRGELEGLRRDRRASPKRLERLERRIAALGEGATTDEATTAVPPAVGQARS